MTEGNPRGTKCTPQPQMEGFAVTCPESNRRAPDASRLISDFCSSPRSFGFSFLQTPPRGDALAVSLTFGSTKTWLPDSHRHSYVPCSAHTFALRRVRLARRLRRVVGHQMFRRPRHRSTNETPTRRHPAFHRLTYWFCPASCWYVWQRRTLVL